jgi:hypothetical protein
VGERDQFQRDVGAPRLALRRRDGGWLTEPLDEEALGPACDADLEKR